MWKKAREAWPLREGTLAPIDRGSFVKGRPKRLPLIERLRPDEASEKHTCATAYCYDNVARSILTLLSLQPTLSISSSQLQRRSREQRSSSVRLWRGR